MSDMPKRHSDRLRKVQSTRDELLTLVRQHRNGEDAGVRNVARILSRYIAAGRRQQAQGANASGSGKGRSGSGKVLGS